VPDDRTPRQIVEANEDRIREAAKWLVASFAAVGAALIAGSQLSNIGRLPACFELSVRCTRLGVALAGAILALASVAWAIWTAVLLLVPNKLPLSALRARWAEGGEDSSLRRYFRANPVFLQGFDDLDDLEARQVAAFDEFDRLSNAFDNAGNKKTKIRIVGDMNAKKTEIDDILARSEAVVSVANFQLLSDEFKTTSLHRLLLAAVVAAIGIGLFAWASNPPAQADVSVVLADLDFSRHDLSGASLPNADLKGANLSGADLTSTNLRGADLTGANLSGADLSAANLQGATLDDANLAGVTWEATTCPDGAISDLVGGSCTAHL
jgi:hypothetical protein